MQMKRYLLLLFLFVGVGQADEFPSEFNNGTDSHGGASKEQFGKLERSENKLTQFSFSEPSSRELVEWNEETRILRVFIPIPCDHKWDKSKWHLESYNVFVHQPVEVCKKCGLIRIPLKDLKK